MIIARGMKTYTVNLEIESDEEIRNSFIFFRERGNAQKVVDFIEENVKPLVPFRRIKDFSWMKIYEGNTGTLYIEVTFNLENENYLGKF